jgi:hypothetical protein
MFDNCAFAKDHCFEPLSSEDRYEREPQRLFIAIFFLLFFYCFRLLFCLGGSYAHHGHYDRKEERAKGGAWWRSPLNVVAWALLDGLLAKEA